MERYSASVKAFDTVVRYFEEHEWRFTWHEDQQTLLLGVAAKNGRYQCFAHVRSEQPVVAVYSIAGVRVPKAKLPAMAEFLARANHGLCIGNFELDYSDGEVRYKTSLDVQDGELTEAMVKVLVHANLSTMDRYFPGMMAVLSGDGSPEAAVARIEGTPAAHASPPSPAAAQAPLNPPAGWSRRRFPWISN